MTQNEKTKFRSSPQWRALRKKIKDDQKIDPITGKPLSNTFNTHHLNVDDDQYTNITDESHFIGLNKQSHDLVHFVWR